MTPIKKYHPPENVQRVGAEEISSIPLPLFFSAQTTDELKQLAKKYIELLEDTPIPLNEFAQKIALQRSQFEYRVAIIGRDTRDIIEKLQQFVSDKQNLMIVEGRSQFVQKPKTAFLFSGQGPQWFAMGRQLLQTNQTFQLTIHEIDGYLREFGWLKKDNSSLLAELNKSENESRINQTHIVQPAIFALQVGLARIWQEMGVHPDMVIGHSIGEVASAHLCGALSLKEATKVMYWRSRCQSKLSGLGKMMAAGLSVADAEKWLAPFAGKIDIAAVNAPSMLTLAGDANAIDALAKILADNRTFHRILMIDMPFHSYLLEDVTKDFIRDAPEFKCDPIQIPMYSTVNGDCDGESHFGKEYWAQNIRQTVLFYPTIQKMVQDGARVFVEISPHPILSHGVSTAFKEFKEKGCVVPSLRRKKDECITMAKSLSLLYVKGYPIDWNQLFEHFCDSSVSLPLSPRKYETYSVCSQKL